MAKVAGLPGQPWQPDIGQRLSPWMLYPGQFKKRGCGCFRAANILVKVKGNILSQSLPPCCSSQQVQQPVSFLHTWVSALPPGASLFLTAEVALPTPWEADKHSSILAQLFLQDLSHIFQIPGTDAPQQVRFPPREAAEKPAGFPHRSLDLYHLAPWILQGKWVKPSLPGPASAGCQHSCPF